MKYQTDPHPRVDPDEIDPGSLGSGTDCILDMRVVNTNAASYLYKELEKSLEVAEKYKKCKYLESCLQQWRHFCPFFVSIKGVLGAEAEAMLK